MFADCFFCFVFLMVSQHSSTSVLATAGEPASQTESEPTPVLAEDCLPRICSESFL